MSIPYKKRKKGAPPRHVLTDSEAVPPVIVGDGPAIPRPDDPGLVYAWRIVLVLTIALLIILSSYHLVAQWLVGFWADGDAPERLVKAATEDNLYLLGLGFLPDGVLVTLKVTFYGIMVALILGSVTGLGRVSKNLTINTIASCYVEAVRGVPLMVQLIYIYYGLSKFVKFSPIFSAVMALGFCYGAYMGEVIRGSIKAIDRGQHEAAVSLGFSSFQAMRYVIVPQALRTILPPVGNEFIALLKDSAMVSVVAVPDIMRRAKEFGSFHMTFFEVYTMAALVYLLMTLILSKFVSESEIRLSHYERR